MRESSLRMLIKNENENLRIMRISLQFLYILIDEYKEVFGMYILLVVEKLTTSECVLFYLLVNQSPLLLS